MICINTEKDMYVGIALFMVGLNFPLNFSGSIVRSSIHEYWSPNNIPVFNIEMTYQRFDIDPIDLL